MKKRCEQCEACRMVERVRTSLFASMARTHTGEDGRLIWNSTLADFPCVAGEEEKVTA